MIAMQLFLLVPPSAARRKKWAGTPRTPAGDEVPCTPKPTPIGISQHLGWGRNPLHP